MEYKLNDAEFTLLLLIFETPNVNGYVLRNLVAERGLEAWAGVSSSSIYVVLKKLESRGLVISGDDLEKRTKGPRGKIFTVLPSGKAALMTALEDALSRTREQDKRFNIALSGINLLDHQRAIGCLQEREKFLMSEQLRLSNIEKTQTALPLSARLLFGRIISGIKAERIWLTQAIEIISTDGVPNAGHS